MNRSFVRPGQAEPRANIKSGPARDGALCIGIFWAPFAKLSVDESEAATGTGVLVFLCALVKPRTR